MNLIYYVQLKRIKHGVAPKKRRIFMGKVKKVKNPDKLGTGKFLAWTSRGISTAVQVVLTSFLVIYCTNALGMSPVLVGTLMMASKIFDGITDLFAGYLIDNTRTRWGKGRPYELSVIGLWLTTWLSFSVPGGASTTVQAAWVFIFYTLSQSIFNTLLSANGTTYMVRAFNDQKQFATLMSVGGLLTTVVIILFNTIFPIFEAQILYSSTGWSKLVLFIAIPMTIIGLMRFIFIKETVVIEADSTEKVSLKDIKKVLTTNKYIYQVALIFLIVSMTGSVNIANYYFIYVIGNVGLAGIMGLFSVLAMLTLLLYPFLLKKMSIRRLMQLGAAFAIPGGLILFFAKDNLPLLIFGSVLGAIANLPVSYMSGLLIVDCAQYNEWIGNKRLEGTITSITGFANKIGAAAGVFLSGLLLEFAKFNGTLTSQPSSAIWMLRFMLGILPVIFAVIIILCLQAYKLDKMKDQMEYDISERRERELNVSEPSCVGNN